MIGRENVATVTLSALASHFGMESLIGKPLAIIPDSRYNGRDADVVVSRLLMISGEDSPDVPRKNKTDWRGRLPTRLLMASNLMPKLREESGVIASRFVTLYFSQDFTGREDRGLTEKLLGELPGILNWALDGLDRLRKQGHFTTTENAESDLEEMERNASKEKGFAYDRCEIGELGFMVEKEKLYEQFKAWSFSQGYPVAVELPTFIRNLKASFPSIDTNYRPPRQPDGGRPRGPLRGIRLLTPYAGAPGSTRGESGPGSGPGSASP
jgi:putative DNA primase/helicase